MGAGDLWLRNARVPDSTAPTDIVLRLGHGSTRSAALRPAGTAQQSMRADTSCSPARRRPCPCRQDALGVALAAALGGIGLAALIENERTTVASCRRCSERAAALFESYSANGTTLIRTHVDVDLDNGVTAVEGVLEAAARFGDRLDVEVVAFPQSGMLIAPGTADLLDAAVEAGAALVGGIDPAGLDGDAVAHLDTVFAIADRRGCGVDVHLHDRGTLGRWQLGLIVERTRALGLQGRVTVSHAFCLCDGDPAVEPLLEHLAEQRIALATVAPGSAEPLPLARIAELGIAVCLGQDGVRDLWSPWGDADMLSRAAQLAWRAGFRRDDDIALCVEIASSRGAAALGVADQLVAPGGRGDLVLVDASCPAEAAVAHPPARWSSSAACRCPARWP